MIRPKKPDYKAMLSKEDRTKHERVQRVLPPTLSREQLLKKAAGLPIV